MPVELVRTQNFQCGAGQVPAMLLEIAGFVRFNFADVVTLVVRLDSKLGFIGQLYYTMPDEPLTVSEQVSPPKEAP